MAGPLKVNRELADKVRKLALGEYVLAIEDTEHKIYSKDFRNQLLLKLAGTVLPRVNEHTGLDGEQLFPNPILNALSNNNRNPEDSKPEEKN